MSDVNLLTGQTGEAKQLKAAVRRRRRVQESQRLTAEYDTVFIRHTSKHNILKRPLVDLWLEKYRDNNQLNASVVFVTRRGFRD